MLMEIEQSNEGWQLANEQPKAPPASRAAQNQPIMSWTASEFVEHEKSSGWYVQFALVSVVLAALVFLITRDFVSLGVMFFIAFGFGYLASRTPKVLNYSLTDKGINIGSKFYPFAAFKSFSVIKHGAFDSIALMPLQRFMPSITVYFPPDNENSVVNFIGQALPHEEHKADSIDRFLQKIRF